MKMLDKFLPEYHYNEIHVKNIMAPAEKVYHSILQLDIGKSLVSRLLFKLRGLRSKNISMAAMVDTGSFFTLYKEENREWITGLLAETLRTPVQLKSNEEFAKWNPGRGIKIAWNFLLESRTPEQVRIITETRIQCLDSRSKYIFAVYWTFVRPFSGLIRHEMLRLLKNECEQINQDVPLSL